MKGENRELRDPVRPLSKKEKLSKANGNLLE